MTDTMIETETTIENADDFFDELDERVGLNGFDEHQWSFPVGKNGKSYQERSNDMDHEQVGAALVDGMPQLTPIDPRADVPPEREFVKLSRRVCLIQRSKGAEGSGLLVGPDLMLTAAHTLMGTDGVFANPDEVTILFDQFVWNEKTKTRAHGDACKLRRIPFTNQPDVVASSILVDPKSRRMIDDNEFDSVLVRLDRPIGLMFLPYSHRIRGWNNCRRADMRAIGKVFVVHHPLGGLQQLAAGEIVSDDPLPDFPTFFKYKTVTLNGSSGSPIVDQNRRVVGIHVGERSTAEQFGVSFQRIFKDLQDKKVQLPGFLLTKEIMDYVFGHSETEKARKPSGRDWRGDRLFDQVLYDHTPVPNIPSISS